MKMIEQYKDTYAEYEELLASVTNETDKASILSDIKELQGDIISCGESLLSWIEEIETMLPDALDAASERLSLFTN
jgi:predicted RNase H-like nuclease (RuvC/YqgF family)